MTDEERRYREAVLTELQEIRALLAWQKATMLKAQEEAEANLTEAIQRAAEAGKRVNRELMQEAADWPRTRRPEWEKGGRDA